MENPDSPGHGFLLIAVPRSAHGPHAVTAQPTTPTEVALRYPRRAGSKTDWLSETHVATAYQQRFQAAADRQERMRDIQTDIVTDYIQRAQPHLLVSLVPDVPGAMTVNQRTFASYRGTLAVSKPFLGAGDTAFPDIQVGRGKLRAGWPEPNTRRDVAYLYHDGSGTWAHPFRDAHLHPDGDDGQVRVLRAYGLVRQVMSAVAFLASHARDRCGTTGTANIEVDLVDEMYTHPYAPPEPIRRPGVPTRDPAYPLVLDQGSPWEEVETLVIVEAQASATALLDDLADAGIGLVQATSVLADQLFHCFGIPEARPVTAAGEVRRPAHDDAHSAALLLWAQARNIPVI